MSTEKSKAIELALSKLTTEEKILLGLEKKPSKPRVKKNYKLTVYYMIGDSNGDTDESVTASLKNPFVLTLKGALDKLKNKENSWGISLEDEDYYDNYERGNISKLECDLLCLVSNYNYDEEIAKEFFKEHGFEDTQENHDYLQEFEGLLVSDTEYYFLVFQGCHLK